MYVHFSSMTHFYSEFVPENKYGDRTCESIEVIVTEPRQQLSVNTSPDVLSMCTKYNVRTSEHMFVRHDFNTPEL